jgi:hypothetical protein
MTKFEKCWGIYTGKGMARKQLFSNQTFSRIRTATFLKPSHSSYLPAYEDGTECSETSAYKIQTLGNYPEQSIQYSERGRSLKLKLFSNSLSKCPPYFPGQNKWHFLLGSLKKTYKILTYSMCDACQGNLVHGDDKY